MSSAARVAESGDRIGTLVPLRGDLLVKFATYADVSDAFSCLARGDEVGAVQALGKVKDLADIKTLYSILGNLTGKLLAQGSILEAERLLDARENSVSENSVSEDKEQEERP